MWNERIGRGGTAALSAVLLAGIGMGLTATSASGAGARCEVGSVCLFADLDSNGLSVVRPVDPLPSGYCLNEIGTFDYQAASADNQITSANNGSLRNIVIYEHPGCTGRALVLPPLSYFPDLRAQGFDDIVSSVRF